MLDYFFELISTIDPRVLEAGVTFRKVLYGAGAIFTTVATLWKLFRWLFSRLFNRVGGPDIEMSCVWIPSNINNKPSAGKLRFRLINNVEHNETVSDLGFYVSFCRKYVSIGRYKNVFDRFLINLPVTLYYAEERIVEIEPMTFYSFKFWIADSISTWALKFPPVLWLILRFTYIYAYIPRFKKPIKARLSKDIRKLLLKELPIFASKRSDSPSPS